MLQSWAADLHSSQSSADMNSSPVGKQASVAQLVSHFRKPSVNARHLRLGLDSSQPQLMSMWALQCWHCMLCLPLSVYVASVRFSLDSNQTQMCPLHVMWASSNYNLLLLSQR